MTVEPIVTASTQVNPQFWLSAAHAALRRFCGWHVAPVITETLTLDGSGGKTLLLPSKRIVSIESVISDGVDVTDRVEVSKNAGMIEFGGHWSRKLGGIVIELTHGYEVDEVLDVSALIVTLTKRARESGRTVASQAIGPANVRYITGTDGSVPGLPLFESEKETLEPYRLNWGP